MGVPVARRTPTQGGWRVLRGALLAGVALLLTVVGHAAAGGAVPDAGLLVVLGLLLAGVLAALADRQPSLGALLLILGGSQLALHVLLDALAGHAHGSAPAATAAPPLPMITAHVLLTVITGWLLRGADHAMFALAAGLTRLLPGLNPGPPRLLAPRTMLRPIPPAPPWQVDVVLRRILPRRGPPL